MKEYRRKMAEYETRCTQVRKENADRKAGREILLSYVDTLRVHFHTCSAFMAAQTGTDSERLAKGWQMWVDGIDGHCITGDHAHCDPGAVCHLASYVSRCALPPTTLDPAPAHRAARDRPTRRRPAGTPR